MVTKSYIHFTGFLRKDLIAGTSSKEILQKITKYQYSIRFIAWLMDNILLRGGCCLAGVPERQMALGLHRPNNLAMVIERVFFKTDLVKDNYFYSGYILGYYKPDCCPRYLQKENYLKMRANLQVPFLLPLPAHSSPIPPFPFIQF